MQIDSPARCDLQVLMDERSLEIAHHDLGGDLISALSQADPFVPSIYCYDDRGSALFEERCQQPEYYLRRVELSLLEAKLPEIADLTGPVDLVELGCGNSIKTIPIVEAYSQTFGRSDPRFEIVYSPIDVNRQALEEGVQFLLNRCSKLRVRGFVSNYEDALGRLSADGACRARMFLFLGSTIGNLDDPALDELLRCFRDCLKPGDFLLLGADLLKDPEVLALAYDDAAGVGRAMEINALIHINRLFDGDFAPELFRYEARFEPAQERVAARLYSLRNQEVTLRRLDFVLKLQAGDTLRIGNMRKFRVSDLTERFARFELGQKCHWTDEDDWYALLLFQKQSGQPANNRA